MLGSIFQHHGEHMGIDCLIFWNTAGPGPTSKVDSSSWRRCSSAAAVVELCCASTGGALENCSRMYSEWDFVQIYGRYKSPIAKANDSISTFPARLNVSQLVFELLYLQPSSTQRVP